MNFPITNCQVCNATEEDGCLFYFPKSKARAIAWLNALNLSLCVNKVMGHYKVCLKHFEDKCFTNTLKQKLNRNALPSLLPSISDEAEPFTTSEPDSTTWQEEVSEMNALPSLLPSISDKAEPLTTSEPNSTTWQEEVSEINAIPSLLPSILDEAEPLTTSESNSTTWQEEVSEMLKSLDMNSWVISTIV
ncbi:uncharacterized protein LOC123301197 [Chrysoperla carnea]|uniref:uncharacterized protein LOC123301197 n=1 Tax=Chrysoperla carnea TaxID=189513 RepID=UPI001D084731|nr:uncharacterized protein LOC123301197 [Chrysoperla carnea]